MRFHPASTSLSRTRRRLFLFSFLAYVVIGTTSLTGYVRAHKTPQSNGSVSTASAANGDSAVPPESIAAAYGVNLATLTLSGSDTNGDLPGIQLPTELGGTTVEVNGVRAPLFFVSPFQVNYLIPAGTPAGLANVVVRSGDGTVSNGSANVVQVAPAIFSANANGSGVPAAVLVRAKANGEQNFESVADFDPINLEFKTKSIDLGPAGERVFLILYLTGIRKAQDPNSDGNLRESMRVLMGDETLTPAFAGPQNSFVGLEQLNVEIPRSLLGRGIIDISVEAIGFTISNPVKIQLGSPSGGAPPQILGFGSPKALAGEELAINGGGFAGAVDDNTVRIAGSEASVMTASPSQLKVSVPLGVQSGTVSVTTPLGENYSAEALPIRTSISGVVEDTSRQPLKDISIKVLNEGITAKTNQEGVFVLPDVPAGGQVVEVAGNSAQVDPPFPNVILKIQTTANRDNNLARSIALQQSTGSSGTIGSGGSGLTVQSLIASPQLAAQDEIVIETDGFQLSVPADSPVRFPDGRTGGAITLTPLLGGRTPVTLPRGFFSASVVQITPFNVQIDAGATLTFPNTESLAPGTSVDVFRYDSTAGAFIREPQQGTVTPDGKSIVSAPGSIKITNFYFAAVSQQTTTVKGRVLEQSGKPVAKALATVRGQEAFTDGTGTFLLRAVPAKAGETITAEISFPRLLSRLERTLSLGAPAVIGGVTILPDVVLGGKTENRPPVITAPTKVELVAGLITTVRVGVSDPDEGQTIDVSITGLNFVTLTKPARGGVYLLTFSPLLANLGRQVLTVTAADNLGASAKVDINLAIIGGNQGPSAASKSVSTLQDTPLEIKLDAADPDGDALRYRLATLPSSGQLTGAAPNVVYTPNKGYLGQDRFSFLVSDGRLQSDTAIISINVTPPARQ